MTRLRVAPIITTLVVASLPIAGCAKDDPAVLRGPQHLRGRASAMQVGESVPIAMAMIEAEVPPPDAALNACLSKVRARLTGGGYSPERSGGPDIYEAAVVAMALAHLDAEARGG